MFNSMFDKKPPQKSGPIAWEPTRRSPLHRIIRRDAAKASPRFFAGACRMAKPWRPGAWKSSAPLRNGKRFRSLETARSTPGTSRSITSPRIKRIIICCSWTGNRRRIKIATAWRLPRGPEEEQYTLLTDRGPRVFMLFAQTK